jgi:hypothetical protein
MEVRWGKNAFNFEGMPSAMHIVERYRLIDGAVAKAQIDKYETSEGTVGAGARDAG